MRLMNVVMDDIRPFKDAQGISRCHLVLEPVVTPVDSRPCRPFQGWRYLDARSAPRDLDSFAGDAAALPETFFTVWANLFGHGKLAAGETALVHGGTSGIGTTAIMLGTAMGAKIIATAGSDEKCAECLKLGAVAAINYRSQDFVEEVKRATDGALVNVVLDMVGGPYMQKNLRCLAMDGRLVFIAFLGGEMAENLDLRPIMLKRLVVTGSTMRPRSTAQKGAIATALLDKVFAAFNHGSGEECDFFIGNKIRSLSVNDFVAIGGCWYKCESMGWSPTSEAEINRIEGMVFDHPDFIHGAWFALNDVMWLENQRNLI
jgi:hypothetical protein